MAATWSGFTEEDQEKIRANCDVDTTSVKIKKPDKVGSLEGPAVTRRKEKSCSNKMDIEQNTKNSVTIQSNPEGDQVIIATTTTKNKNQSGESPSHVKLKIKEGASYEIVEAQPIQDISNTENKEQSKQRDSPLHSTPVIVDILTNGERKEKIDLEEFERRQKLIEEQNRIKKEMLGKALALRKRKTAAEAHKLQQIQQELSQLDANLSNDVAILRGQIEIASVELTEAEKRYSKAERDFIEAKQLLFSKRERKELLTEHLCAIIEQNELRKAHRLTDLMVQLNEQDQITEAALTQMVPTESEP